jgi:hypothetical protein
MAPAATRIVVVLSCSSGAVIRVSWFRGHEMAVLLIASHSLELSPGPAHPRCRRRALLWTAAGCVAQRSTAQSS